MPTSLSGATYFFRCFQFLFAFWWGSYHPVRYAHMCLYVRVSACLCASVPLCLLGASVAGCLGVCGSVFCGRDIASARLEWVESCGHVPHLEQPRQTADTIAAFISQNQ